MMNTLFSPAAARLLSVLSLLVVGVISGCGGSTGPVVGADVERRVYLLRGQDVDQPPEIVGGYAKVEELKKYPAAAEEDEAYGVIWLQCTVSAGGVATRVNLAQGGHPALETEALNVIQRLSFRPALKNGAPVQAQIQIPVIFQGPYARPKTAQSG
jgi:TonB family protein